MNEPRALTRIVVTVDDDAFIEPEPLLARLDKIAFEVDEYLEFTGNVLGYWDGDLNVLRAVEGVLDAEYESESFPQTD
ncbi:MAG: hypothetical protein AAF515_06690 [Pseudomonadota bacterium]